MSSTLQAICVYVDVAMPRGGESVRIPQHFLLGETFHVSADGFDRVLDETQSNFRVHISESMNGIPRLLF